MLSSTEILSLHSQKKIDLHVCVDITTKEDLAIWYTPSVALPCLEIQKDPNAAYIYTGKKNTVAIISDGTAVLGLGNIGGLSSLPVLEGKSMLLKKFGQTNCVPLTLSTTDPSEIISTITNISGGFGAIILEDIAAPACFFIEDTLKENLNIPVFHDDQHGTAIVILTGLINALKVTNRNKETTKIVLAGAGAGGLATAALLRDAGFFHIIILDSKGSLSTGREAMNRYKEALLDLNLTGYIGGLDGALVDADVFIGLSGQGGMMTLERIALMRPDPILFAASNPNPEVLPETGLDAGAGVVATGRSDYPNQLNNLMVFPGLFRGVLEMRAKEIPTALKISLAYILADLVLLPTAEMIVPSCVDQKTHDAVYNEVKRWYSVG